MQALYAQTRNGNSDLRLLDRDLENSMEKTYDLFLTQLLIIGAVHTMAEQKIEDGKNKKLPSEEELNPNTRFIDNAVIKQINQNPKLLDLLKSTHLDEDAYQKIVRKIFKQLLNSPAYDKYMHGPAPDFNDQKSLAIDLFVDIIAPNEELHQQFEDQNMQWVDDLSVANTAVLNFLRSFKSDDFLKIPKLFKDADDKAFGARLLQMSILHHKEYEEMIQNQTKNWELDRIAVIDILLIKMALVEMIYFPTIPIKVSINEYIELSKDFSTEKSKGFINGVLDKLAERLKNEGLIKKTGRGLIE
ncbi:MAG: N utilization substance protein B [Flavobacteriales bacterium]|jgi:N utilization substance protein B